MEVGGSYHCAFNLLQDLNGSPRTVGSYYNCDGNDLESLEGAPERVGGVFSCYNNPLRSLKGVPETVSYNLPDKYTEKDVEKEIERRNFRKGLDTKTASTFGDFVDQL